MKKFAFILFVLGLIVSCTEEEIMEPGSTVGNSVVPDKSDMRVHMEDIYKLVSGKSSTRSNTLAKIQPYLYENDTVFYVVTYNKGWEVMPANENYPLVIAFNESDSFNPERMNVSQKAWFENISKEIHIQNLADKVTMSENVKLWNHALNRTESVLDTRSAGWAYHNTRTVVTTTQKSHLLSTLWKQSSPYNIYCPFKTGSSSEHCPAGCVAIAGAQTLAYLHDFLGMPDHAMGSASYISSSNSYSFSSWGTNSWTQIENGNSQAIARLVGHVGILCGMSYGDDASSADTYNDLPTALSYYGISCDRTNSWNSSLILQNIDNSLPVIGRFSNGSQGHSVVIDGYMRQDFACTDVYVYRTDDSSDPYDHDGEDPTPDEGPTMEENYSYSRVYYLINWGWGSLDNTYYLSTASMQGFSEGEKMLYNFSRE